MHCDHRWFGSGSLAHCWRIFSATTNFGTNGSVQNPASVCLCITTCGRTLCTAIVINTTVLQDGWQDVKIHLLLLFLSQSNSTWCSLQSKDDIFHRHNNIRFTYSINSYTDCIHRHNRKRFHHCHNCYKQQQQQQNTATATAPVAFYRRWNNRSMAGVFSNYASSAVETTGLY